MKRLLLLVALLAGAIHAQPIPAQAVLKGSPSGGIGGSCTSTVGYLTAAGQYVSCVSHVWTVATGGGGGTSVTITGTGSQITVTGAGCAAATGPCALSLANPINVATSSTAANLSGTPALPNGTTGTTQSAGANDTKLATDAYVDTLADGKVKVGNGSNVGTAVTPGGDVTMTNAGSFTVAKIGGTTIVAASIYTSLFSGFTAYNNPEPCIKGTIAYTDIQAAANTTAISIGTVTEPFSPRTMYVYESTQFASASITSLTVSLGSAGSPTYYLPAFAAMQGSPVTHDGGNVPPASNTGSTVITALFTSDGVHNLSALTAGVVQVKICGVALQ